MSSSTSSYTKMIFIFLALGSVLSQLSDESYYSTSCPSAISTIRTGVSAAVASESRMGASLLRLHFHDCFVNGCDASVLLDDNSTFIGEKTALPNNGSLRGFEVIDSIKAQLEEECPGVVSCADILAVVARDSVVELGGPTWDVQLGRRDSAGANITLANSDLPAPTLNLSALMAAFSKKGLTLQDLVALSGAHTIGQARCITFRTRIYNDTNINATYAAALQENCPVTGGDDNLSPLDVMNATLFDNAYFVNLQTQMGLLHSDQELFNVSSTNGRLNNYGSNQATFLRVFSRAMMRMGSVSHLEGANLRLYSHQKLLDDSSANDLVNTYSTNQTTFFCDFSNSMISMGAISPLTGTSGSIRTNCRVAN